MKLVGSVYLVGVGIRRILSKDDAADPEVQPAPLRRLYRQGVVVNVLNPKTALFFLAFLPQFVDTHHSVAPQVALLGLVFATIALSSDLLYALLADLLAGRLRRNGGGARFRRYVAGGIFVALGLTAAVARRAT